MSIESGTKNIDDLKRELTREGRLSLHFPASEFAKKLVTWFEKNKLPHPWRQKFERTRDPYFVWISEIMLQQTVIAAVIPKYNAFIDKFKNVEQLAKAPEKDLQQAVSGLGYYRRFRMMHEAAKQIHSMGTFPDSYAEILKLRGVGEYTASAVSSICFGEEEAVIDGNVERVFCRLFDLRLPPNMPILKKVFKKTANLIIGGQPTGNFNQGIMELGQIICTPSNPNCSDCPVRIFCKAFEHNSTREAPAKKLKKKFIDLKTTVMIVKYKDRFLLHSRADESKFLKGVDGFQIKTENATSGKVLGSFKHTITNHKLTNEVVLVTKGSRGVDEKGSWLPIETLAKSITTSFDKKAFAVLEKTMRVPN